MNQQESSSVNSWQLTALSAVVLVATVLLQERNVDSLALIELAVCSGDSDGVVESSATYYTIVVRQLYEHYKSD